MQTTVHHIAVTDSTNTALKQMALSGAPHGTVLIADRQTGGKGRMGRTFFSPVGGLYMSVLLRDTVLAGNTAWITVAAAVAAAEAAEALCGKEVGIKWVNDLYLDGRKVCGILAEAMTDTATGECAVVVGFGLNIAVPSGGFPEEMRDIAGALLTHAPPDTRDRLAADILARFDRYLSAPTAGVIAAYRKRSILDGKDITFTENGVSRSGTVLGVTENGGLRVRLPDNTERVLSSGEVTMHRT